MPEEVSFRTADAHDVQGLVRNLEDRHGLLDHLRHRRGILLFAFRRDGAGDEVFAGHIFIRMGPNDEPELEAGLPSVPLLMYLRVRDEYRRNGLGRQLVDAAEKALTRQGQRMVALGVAPGNDRAIALYESLSFLRWRNQPIKTQGWVVRDDGQVDQVEEECLIYYKELAIGPASGGR